MEQTYIVMDFQDVTDYWEGTLNDVRQFYANIWEQGWEEEFDSEEEFDKFWEQIWEADIDWLCEKLEIMEWTIFSSEKEMLEWRKEVGL